MAPSEDFRTFYVRHHADVVRYARRRVAPDHVADVAAETFAVAWRRWAKAEPGGLPWLYLTARHVIANHRRRLRDETSLDHSGLEPLVADATPAVVDRLVLRQRMRTLAEGDREVLMLAYWEDLDLRSIGRALGCSAGAAGVRLHRARRRLAAALGPPGTDAPPPTRSHHREVPSS